MRELETQLRELSVKYIGLQVRLMNHEHHPDYAADLERAARSLEEPSERKPPA